MNILRIILLHEVHRVEAGIMRRMVLWDTACNFNAFISNQSIFNCLIIGASILLGSQSSECYVASICLL